MSILETLTLRDLFALTALPGLLASPQHHTFEEEGKRVRINSPEGFAAAAYAYADALLKERTQ